MPDGALCLLAVLLHERVPALNETNRAPGGAELGGG